jgi:hypothetical protein
MTREDNALTYYVLFFIHVGRRKVYLGRMAANPNESWIRQAARNRPHILVENSSRHISRIQYPDRGFWEIRDWRKLTNGADIRKKWSAVSVGIVVQRNRLIQSNASHRDRKPAFFSEFSPIP